MPTWIQVERSEVLKVLVTSQLIGVPSFFTIAPWKRISGDVLTDSRITSLSLEPVKTLKI
jgi:hypothetical protein